MIARDSAVHVHPRPAWLVSCVLSTGVLALAISPKTCELLARGKTGGVNDDYSSAGKNESRAVLCWAPLTILEIQSSVKSIS